MRNIVPSGGMKLGEFLREYGKQLKHTRAFYIVEPELEKGKVIKLGIAGMNTGDAYARLKEYEILYGEYDKKNKCKGVKIWFCGITEYNRLVEAPNTQVQKLENKLKREYKMKGDVLRGTERLTNVSPQALIKRVKEIIITLKDTATQITREARPSTKRFRQDTKAYIDSKPKAVQSTRKR